MIRRRTCSIAKKPAQSARTRMNAFQTFAVALGLLTIADGAPASAQQFNQFVGNWSGSGTITVRDGGRERLRCRGQFTGGSNALTMALRCASDSYRFELQ